MYVLTFVMAMLMVLIAMSYARLQQLRDAEAIRTHFIYYTQQRELSFFNNEAKHRYESNNVPASSAKTNGHNGPAKGVSRRLSIALLVDPQARINQPIKYAQESFFLKQLITALYSRQEFFRKAKQQRPNFLDELLSRLATQIEHEGEKSKIKRARDLANIDLGEEQLNEIFYKILHGKPISKGIEKALTMPKGGEEGVESIEKKEEEEYRSEEGYLSLLDFITVNQQAKIRLYLASPYVLYALLHDSLLVQEIIEKRREIYHQLMADKLSKEQGKQQLEHLLAGYQQREFFDFSISKVNPDK